MTVLVRASALVRVRSVTPQGLVFKRRGEKRRADVDGTVMASMCIHLFHNDAMTTPQRKLYNAESSLIGRHLQRMDSSPYYTTTLATFFYSTHTAKHLILLRRHGSHAFHTCSTEHVRTFLFREHAAQVGAFNFNRIASSSCSVLSWE